MRNSRTIGTSTSANTVHRQSIDLQESGSFSQLKASSPISDFCAKAPDLRSVMRLRFMNAHWYVSDVAHLFIMACW